MPKFKLSRDLPSCTVTKGLILSLEEYLQVTMPERIDGLGSDHNFQITFDEGIGVETMSSIREFAPSLFTDATKEIQMSWNNKYSAQVHLDVSINFDKYGRSRLVVGCDGGSAAREISFGINDAVSRILEPHKNNNWFFSSPNLNASLSRAAVYLVTFTFVPLVVSTISSLRLAWALLSLAVIWFYLSGYAKPNVAFESRRQKSWESVWKYLTLGAITFILFGSIFLAVRRKLFGF